MIARRSIARGLLGAALAAAAFATPAAAQFVTRFEVRGSVISPDGDGTQDETRVVYALADTALALSVVVFEADSVTPVDTLRAPAPDVPAGDRALVWQGRRWDGSPAAEGAYVVTLTALGEDDPDVVRSLPVFIDVTPPAVQIVSVIPDPYAPGVSTAPAALSISFSVINASPVQPGRTPDELKSTFTNPTGAPVTPASLVTTPPFAGADGNYVLAWNATGEVATLPDGEYGVTLTVSDAAGFASVSSYRFEIDTKAPEVRATSLAENAAVQVVPDSLRGWAFDARGVDTLQVRYDPARPFLPVPSAFVRNDSLRFAVPLADSIRGEGAHTVDFRARDRVGRVTIYTFPFRVDLTAPAAPVLDAFDGKWRSDAYPLSGNAANGDATSFVRILRNGVQVDSVSTALGTSFTVRVPLLAGANRLEAVLRDGAFNASPLSNAVTVRFDDGAGLFAPSPFAPGSSFNVNTARDASAVVLRVFDITGDLVASFEDGRALQFYEFPWDGVNNSGVSVRKGPLVAVAAVDYADGTHDVLRRVFLFDPDAR